MFEKVSGLFFIVSRLTYLKRQTRSLPDKWITVGGGDAVKKRKKIDWWILGPYLTLSMIGLLEVYSASSYRLLQADENTKSLLLRQLIFIFLSWGVIFLARSIKLHYLLHPKIAGYGLALSIFFLILVRVGIFGVTVNGAQRWISLFGIQFQPS